MLFDLRGRRKNLIRFIYGGLAVVFMITFIGAGVGVGGGPGGFFDLLKGGGGGQTNTLFDDQIEAAQKQTQVNPKSAAAWLALAKSDFQLANSNAGIDPDTQSLNDRGQQAAIEGIDAWERYLKLNKGNPNSTTAQFAANTYGSVGDAKGALKAQQIVVDRYPDRGNAWAQLALFAYASGNDAARQQGAGQGDRVDRPRQAQHGEGPAQGSGEAGQGLPQAVRQGAEGRQEAAAGASGKGKGGQAAQPFGQPLPGQSAPTGGGL